MADTQAKMAEVFRKIEREKALINAASNMRQSTSNPLVQARVDSNIRDSRRNIGYLEEQMQKLQVQQLGNGGPAPPTHGGQAPLSPGRRGQGADMGNGPMPPPKDGRDYYGGRGDNGGYGDPGPGGYSGSGQMPPRAPYNDPRPYPPKARPNFSKLGRHN